jgi:hypothetical protein
VGEELRPREQQLAWGREGAEQRTRGRQAEQEEEEEAVGPPRRPSGSAAAGQAAVEHCRAKAEQERRRRREAVQQQADRPSGWAVAARREGAAASVTVHPMVLRLEPTAPCQTERPAPVCGCQTGWPALACAQNGRRRRHVTATAWVAAAAAVPPRWETWRQSG